jgi:Integron cassette protein VCH_CASS1 chain
MPQQVTDIDVLRNYLQGVMDRADHHAQNINEVVLAVAGGVVWKKDDDPLEVMIREGEMKNVLWFKVNRDRYALSYNHDTGEIELRRNTTQGPVVASFCNAMSTSQVRSIFGTL